MTGARIAVPLGSCRCCGRGRARRRCRARFEARLLASQDDPVALADPRSRARSIAASPRAKSMPRSPPMTPTSPEALSISRAIATCRSILLLPKGEAPSGRDSATRSLESFARGLFTGEPDDLVGLAGTAVGDLFVFGDIRDAVREGRGLQRAAGRRARCSVWPASVSRSQPEPMRRSGLAPLRGSGSRCSRPRARPAEWRRMAAWIGRSLREVVEWAALNAQSAAPASRSRQRPRAPRARR